MEWAARSDVGLVRKTNEDSYSVRISDEEPSVAIVADGMGGYRGGKIASNVTVEAIIEGIDQFYPDDLHEDSPQVEPTIVIKRAIKYANEKVYNLAQNDTKLAGMGTTVVAAMLCAQEIIIGYVGDSRAYIISDDTIEQITEDHSLVNELISQGKISEQEALIHPQRHMITRALGTAPLVSVDIIKRPWKENDILLLCTDGLSEVVTTDEIVNTIIEQPSIQMAVDTLLEQSLQVGGNDNITIVAIKNKPVTNIQGDRGDEDV